MKGIIYYTDGQLKEPIYSIVQKYILKSGLPVIGSSLFPYRTGESGFDLMNIFDMDRSYPTMVKQIISCLESSTEEYVFFCEHDVLYPKVHFDFTPPRDDIFYYNENVLRWYYGGDHAISYDRLISLSGMCANRELALRHYQLRQEAINNNGWSSDDKGETRWARKMGYEPGTKKIKRGGITDEDYDTWKSEYPIIDIRHKKNYTPPKVKLKDFKHAPKNWQEIPIKEINGWNLVELFNL